MNTQYTRLHVSDCRDAVMLDVFAVPHVTGCQVWIRNLNVCFAHCIRSKVTVFACLLCVKLWISEAAQHQSDMLLWWWKLL